MQSRLYHYYFDGIATPITIEAINSKAARITLNQIIGQLPNYASREVIGETTSSLVTGISTMIRNGRKLIWNGQRWQEKRSAPADPGKRFLYNNGRWEKIT